MEVTIDIPNDLLFRLMLMAHEQDITLNKLINKILKEFMDKEEINKKVTN